MKDKKALKPTHFADIRDIRSLKTKEKVEKENLDPSESLLHGLVGTPGWGVLENIIIETKDELEELTKAQMERGATTEQIGATAVTVLLCKEVLDKILNRVNDAYEAIEEEITKGPKGKGKQ